MPTRRIASSLGAAASAAPLVGAALEAAGGSDNSTGAGEGDDAHPAASAATAATRAATLASITQLTEAARNTVSSAQPELQRTLVSAREAADSARLAMTRVTEMTAPGASQRGDLDAAVRDLSQAARGLRDWSELLEEKPNAIIFGTKRE